jgi:hypothetical protein
MIVNFHTKVNVEALYSSDIDLLEELANHENGSFWLEITSNGHTPLQLKQCICDFLFIHTHSY